MAYKETIETKENQIETFRYVWLDLNTGTFSNSWDEEMQELVSADMQQHARTNNWKLIKYQCLNDEDFSFYNLMQVMTRKTAPKKTKK